MYIILELLDGQEQHLDILESYFRHAAIHNPNTADAGCTTYLSRVGIDFVFKSAMAASTLKPTSPLLSTRRPMRQGRDRQAEEAIEEFLSSLY